MFNLVLFICGDVDVGLQCREKNLFFVFYYKSHILNPSPLQWLNFFMIADQVLDPMTKIFLQPF